VTTIGYGHTAPVTKAGQAFCIAYSVVGMCLFGLMVSALGALMRNSVLTLCERGLKVSQIRPYKALSQNDGKKRIFAKKKCSLEKIDILRAFKIFQL